MEHHLLNILDQWISGSSRSMRPEVLRAGRTQQTVVSAAGTHPEVYVL